MRRRDLAWVLFAGASTAPMVPAQTTPAEDLSAARERVKGNGAELAKFSLLISTEPAFAFKAY